MLHHELAWLIWIVIYNSFRSSWRWIEIEIIGKDLIIINIIIEKPTGIIKCIDVEYWRTFIVFIIINMRFILNVVIIIVNYKGLIHYVPWVANQFTIIFISGIGSIDLPTVSSISLYILPLLDICWIWSYIAAFLLIVHHEVLVLAPKLCNQIIKLLYLSFNNRFLAVPWRLQVLLAIGWTLVETVLLDH